MNKDGMKKRIVDTLRRLGPGPYEGLIMEVFNCGEEKLGLPHEGMFIESLDELRAARVIESDGGWYKIADAYRSGPIPSLDPECAALASAPETAAIPHKPNLRRRIRNSLGLREPQTQGSLD
jgi:hypothetical protein